MKRYERPWMWPIALIALLTGDGKAEDFLYVLATPPGQRSEIHWIPAKAPLTARVLVEDLDLTEFIHRHQGELWWWTEERPVTGNLVGQQADRLSEFSGNRISNIVRQGEMLYWCTTNQLGSYNLDTGEDQVLATSRASIQVQGLSSQSLSGQILFADGTPGFRGLAVYEDRLYFGDGATIDSIRLDGSDRRLVGARDPGIRGGNGPSVLFGPGLDFEVLLRIGSEPAPRGLAVHNDHLIWVNEGAFWQIDLKTGEESTLTGDLPGKVHSMAVSDDAIYWIDDSQVWRWRHGGNEPEPVYKLGDTRFSAISVVTAEPRPSTIVAKERIVVAAEVGGTYQLLFSEDLKSWAPDFVRSNLFNNSGSLSWLKPKLGMGDAPLEWHAKLELRQAYFAAWQYDFGRPFDEDGDELPDYWEQRYFKDLSATSDGDTNGDGLTHLEEARLLVGPNEFDADGDGLSNVDEVNFVPPLNPASNDTDGDTLTDGEEVNVYHSDPQSTDTDSDGFTDDFEVAYGGDLNVREVIPVLNDVLASYDEDLMVHFDFESADNATVLNRGRLGGHGRIVGEESYVIRETEAGETSRALDLAPGPNIFVNVSHVETELTLEDLGFAADEPAVTVSLWLRTERMHRGTFLSAARTEGSEQAISFQVSTDPLTNVVALSLSLAGSHWSSSSTTRNGGGVGMWTHVAWVDGPDGRKIYTNGILRSQQNGSMRPLDGDPKLWLGAQLGRQGASLPFRGAMDDVRIYRRTLPENAIKLLAR